MSGNGVDLGAIYQAIVALDRKLDRRLEEQDRKLDSLAGDVAVLRGDVAALRGDVAAYHGSVVGRGVLIGELEERVGRLERGEPPPKAA